MLFRSISDTAELYRRHPPDTLPAWKRISQASCLRTARTAEVSSQQTLAEGKTYFLRQLSELRALERRQKLMKALWTHRKAIGNVGLALAVGLLAVFLRRSAPVMSLSSLWTRWTKWTYTY